MAVRARFGWSLLLLGAQLGDVASTWLSLHFGVPEKNPLVRAALGHGDFLLLTATKLVLVAALLLLVAASGRHLRTRRATWLALQTLAVGFMAIAVLNTAGVLLTVG